MLDFLCTILYIKYLHLFKETVSHITYALLPVFETLLLSILHMDR